MPRWNRVRPAVLLAALAVIAGFLIKALLAPVPLERPLPVFAFPAAPPVPGWEAEPADDALEAFYLSTQDGVSLELSLRFIADLRLLHFADPDLVTRMRTPGDVPLDTAMHFLADPAGHIKTNVKGGTLALGKLDIRRDAAGFHGFWKDGTRLHLSALLGSNGRTAITSRDLMCNVVLPQFRPRRIARWLVAGAPLPDKRCILADFSLNEGMPPAEMRARLEQAWDAWRAWCAPRFTKLCAEADGP